MTKKHVKFFNKVAISMLKDRSCTGCSHRVICGKAVDENILSERHSKGYYEGKFNSPHCELMKDVHLYFCEDSVLIDDFACENYQEWSNPFLQAPKN